MILTPGLVSITFRSFSPEEIIALVVKAGLKSIEWGGDVHVPHGDVSRAQAVARLTHEAGLTIAAYGSYYRLGQSESQGLSFDRVLESAMALGAPTIRVWAGVKGSQETTGEERLEIVRDGLRVADVAAKVGLTISLEYHGGTLTDTRESVLALLEELNHPSLKFLWQPPVGEPEEECAVRLEDVLPRLGNVHVFHWWPTGRERQPLAEGESKWKRYIEIVRKTGKPTDFLLEFAANDSPEQFLADAATLKHLLDTS